MSRPAAVPMLLQRLLPPALRPRRAVAVFGGVEQIQGLDLSAVLAGDAAVRAGFDRCEEAARRLGLGPIPRTADAVEAPGAILGHQPVAYLTLTALQIALFERERALRGGPPALYSLCGGHAAAAYAAGALDLDGAMRLAAVYATLVETCVRPVGAFGNGAGLWLLGEAARVPAEVFETTRTAPAVFFSDDHALVVGHDIPALARRLDALGVSYRLPRGDRFPTAHTALFDEAEAPFRSWCRELQATAPAHLWYSAATGGWVRAAPDASFWWATVSRPAQCGRDAAALAAEGFVQAVDMGRASAVGTRAFGVQMETRAALAGPDAAANRLTGRARRLVRKVVRRLGGRRPRGVLEG